MKLLHHVIKHGTGDFRHASQFVLGLQQSDSGGIDNPYINIFGSGFHIATTILPREDNGNRPGEKADKGEKHSCAQHTEYSVGIGEMPGDIGARFRKKVAWAQALDGIFGFAGGYEMDDLQKKWEEEEHHPHGKGIDDEIDECGPFCR
jgi:hypothetical protein